MSQSSDSGDSEGGVLFVWFCLGRTRIRKASNRRQVSKHLTRSLTHNYPEAQLSSCVSQLSAEWTVDVSSAPGQGTHSRAHPEAAQGRGPGDGWEGNLRGLRAEMETAYVSARAAIAKSHSLVAQTTGICLLTVLESLRSSVSNNGFSRGLSPWLVGAAFSLSSQDLPTAMSDSQSPLPNDPILHHRPV